MTTQAHQAQPQKPDGERTSVKDVVGVIANMLSVGTATAFLLSVVYEQAYFSVIGRKFLSIASLSDYLTNVLDWLPTVLGGFIAYGLGVTFYSMIMIPKDEKNEKVSKGPQADAVAPEGARQTQNPSAEQETAPGQPKRASETPEWMVILIIVVLALISLGVGAGIYLTSDPASDRWGLVLGITFFGAWSWTWGLAFARGNRLSMGTTVQAVVLFVPPLFVGVIAFAVQQGYHDLNHPGEMYTLIANQPDRQQPEQVNLLRTFERGVLVRLPDQKVNEFLRWDQIRSIRLHRDGEGGKSLGCRHLGLHCPDR